MLGTTTMTNDEKARHLLVDGDRPGGVVPAQASIYHVEFPVVRD